MCVKNKFSIVIILLISVKVFGQNSDTKSGTIKVAKPNCDTCIYDMLNVDIPPNYSGGDVAFINFITKNIHYPELAKESGIKGLVYVTFIINKKGDVINVALMKGPDNKPMQQLSPLPADTLNKEQVANYRESVRQMDEEALRVIRKMPKWSPAIKNKQTVNCRFLLPISFKLQ